MRGAAPGGPGLAIDPWCDVAEAVVAAEAGSLLAAAMDFGSKLQLREI